NSAGYFSFQVNNNANLPLATASGFFGGLEAQARGTGAAFMSFHRPGVYAVHFGLDTDNRLKVGGWSMGAVAHEIWHSGNQASVAAGTTTGHVATWNNVSGRYEASALGTAALANTGTSGATVPLLNGANTWNAVQVFSGGATVSGGGVWHSGNQAAVQAGTATGQLARWNNTAGRYEPVTLNTLTDAADDAAAATAGVAVGGLYRTGSILKTRIA
nr:hypothetical protein [Ralstonia sp.]